MIQRHGLPHAKGAINPELMFCDVCCAGDETFYLEGMGKEEQSNAQCREGVYGG